MQEHDAVIIEKICALIEEGVVKDYADVLEHAHRHDAVEAPVDIAIIDQPEYRLLRPAALGRSILRAPVLFLRQRDSGDARAANLGEVERETAPAAADVEHGCAGIEPELGRQVAFLGKLRVIERRLRGLEIGAAILLVAVEEERIESAVEVVMVRHIAPCAKARIELLQPAQQIAGEPRRPGPTRRRGRFLPEQNGEHIRNRAALDDEGAVHIGFAKFELGIEQNCALGAGAW